LRPSGKQNRENNSAFLSSKNDPFSGLQTRDKKAGAKIVRDKPSPDSTKISRPNFFFEAAAASRSLSQITSDKLENDEFECHLRINKNLNIFGSNEAEQFPDYDLKRTHYTPDKVKACDSEDGKIVETLIIPQHLCFKDVSPTFLPSESDKDSGISVPSTPVISSKEFSCEYISSKAETDFTDASEISEEDKNDEDKYDEDDYEEEKDEEDSTETFKFETARAKSPFARKIWNRRNGVYRVRRGILGPTTQPPFLNQEMEPGTSQAPLFIQETEPGTYQPPFLGQETEATGCQPSCSIQETMMRQLEPVVSSTLDVRSEIARMRLEIAKMKEEMEVMENYTEDEDENVEEEFLDRSYDDEFSYNSDLYSSEPEGSEYSSEDEVSD